ncbi:exopolysaccharide biosynthesis polyprenyl glycosylphosphotransferase [Arsenicitalea aurantiaca]|nr:exopolysaccharide biosynthesis polyprenyl glycosylphosphotransferase [Arsenicitalea aurantiaca]
MQQSEPLAGATRLRAGRRGFRRLEDGNLVASLMLLAADFCIVLLAGLVADMLWHLVVHGYALSLHGLRNALSAALIFSLLQAVGGQYAASWVLGRAPAQSNLSRDWLATMAIVLIASFLAQDTSELSRGALIVFAGLGWLMLVGARPVIVLLLAQAVKTRRFETRRIVLVGDPGELEHYYMRQKLWRKGISIAGAMFVDLGRPDVGLGFWDAEEQREIPLDRPDAILRHLRQMEPDDILLALPWSASDAIDALLHQFSPLPAAIYLSPDPALSHIESNFLGQTSLSQAMVDRETGLSGIQVIRRPLSPAKRLVKRSFDLLAAGTGVLLLSPLFIVIAIAIRLESPGPAFFRQDRHGFNERPFRIFKFRSMTTAHEAGPFRQTAVGDARITRLGGFLRRSNLDELPQLFNVILGHMSLVGPRPHALEHNDAFMAEIASYARRHHVKPGITGWAQVNGLRGAADTEAKMAMRVAHDLHYINNWSLWLDVKIILLTVFSRKAFANAY